MQRGRAREGETAGGQGKPEASLRRIQTPVACLFIAAEVNESGINMQKDSEVEPLISEKLDVLESAVTCPADRTAFTFSLSSDSEMSISGRRRFDDG
jgi:hypothetical protein